MFKGLQSIIHQVSSLQVRGYSHAQAVFLYIHIKIWGLCLALLKFSSLGGYCCHSIQELAWLLYVVPGLAGNSMLNRFRERVREEDEFVMCVSSIAFTVETW